MAEKTLNTRIQQKHDIEANWLKAVNFIPKIGEVIVYDIDETHATPRMKIGDGVKNINELEFIGEKAATPNWNASEGEPGYIENRTHYIGLGEILLETDIVVSEDMGQGTVIIPFTLEVGKTYIVTLNNTEYSCTAWQISNTPIVGLGNGLMVGQEAYSSNEPFAIGIAPQAQDSETNALILITNPGEYSIKITTESIYHKLDYKYIPNSDWGARVNEPGHILNRTHWEEKEIGVALEEVSIPYNTYNSCFYITDEFNFFPLEGTAYVTFNGERYETKCTYGDDDAESVTSFDIGNKFLHHDDEENTGEPFFIHILYYTNSGYNSMNCYLIANSDIVDTITLKIEGIKTRNIQQLDPIFLPNSNIINGVAEGSIRMLNTSEEIGLDAFAEGIYTSALGDGSHAEGFTTVANGGFAHAEGENTNANGLASHAEGSGTIATSWYSHVQGKYNIEDTTDTYAHIVGNGSRSICSNAHTLDWDGNAWFSGDVYIGSTSGVNRDEGSKKLATEDYVTTQIAAIPTPDVSGQISAHNVATDAHNDIRLLIEGLTTQLSALLNIDYENSLAFDTSEIVFKSEASNILGTAILGQLVLA